MRGIGGGRIANIVRLGVKELRSLAADRILLVVIVWAFSVGLYVAATGMSRELHNAPVAVVDEDGSQLSAQIVSALYPPYFRTPQRIDWRQMDSGLDRGEYSFALVIPAGFQGDLFAGRRPVIQLNIDATIMSQSFIGSGYIRNIIAGEVLDFVGRGANVSATAPVELLPRVRFNPNLNGMWFGGMMEVINNITMLSIILVGAAFIREREHGTLEHLLVMPLSAFEIIMGKVWANGLVVLLAASFGLLVVVHRLLEVPIAGSISLFLMAAALYLFSTASIGIFLGTLARSMPQFGLLIILVIIPLQLLSGGVTPIESMPVLVQRVMTVAPTPHFIKLAQGVLYRGASMSEVWPQFVAIGLIGGVFFAIAQHRFRKSVTQG
ncbi:ABC transporter permease [Azoarcus sp. L1K30]|uniref:ABC transporter permease n=1 Tax=Azoarcus sp. L1K30 TaxID=2820277 RepID=UPI001B8144DE|nr:ABC transporter permease [Azoarcus sp. L1K30]MBR0566276.1 ABC transporter permease [Azoarcus sp. L1K30]